MELRKRLLVLTCVVWSGWLTGCTGIVISGSGVSFGVVELIIEGAVVVVVLLVLFGLWTLAKTVLARAMIVGLLGGALAAAAVLAVELIPTDGAVQVGSLWELPVVAFVVGFGAAFAWFLRAHHRPIQ